MIKKRLCIGFGVRDVSVYLTNIKNDSTIQSIGILDTHDLLSCIEEN